MALTGCQVEPKAPNPPRLDSQAPPVVASSPMAAPKRVTNRSVAEKIGMTHSMVSRMRSGTRLPSASTQVRISSGLEVPLESVTRAVAAGPNEFKTLFERSIKASARKHRTRI